MKAYYTVKEMTDKVNELLELLDRAKDMAYELRCQNVRDLSALVKATDEAVAEQRPLTWEERIEEAKKYIDLFAAVETNIESALDSVHNNY